MTMDVSTLSIEVKSKGIAQASTALQGRDGNGGLAGAADKAEKSVQKLTDRLNLLMTVGGNATGTAAALSASLRSMLSVLNLVNAQASAAATALGQVTSAMNNNTAATQRADRATRDYVGGSHVLMNTLKALATVATVYAAINFTKNIIETADTYAQLDARLKNVTGSQNNANKAMEDLYRIAQTARAPLKDASTLYVRLYDSMKSMGKGGKEAAENTEAVVLGLKLWGATAAESSSSMLQRSQAFNKGKLDGAEFNSIAENGKPILKAIAAEMGVATEALFKLRSEGKITNEVMARALEKALPAWRKQMEEMPLTFEDAMTRIRNAWFMSIGELGKSTSFNVEMSKSLKVIEDMIPTVAKGLGEAFISVMKWVSENKTKLGEIWDQIVGIASDVWGLVGGFSSWVASILGAGEEVSLVASGLFGVRAVIAAIVDLFKLMATVVANVGIAIARFMVAPVQIVAWAFDNVAAGISKVLNLLSKGASAAGLDGIGNALADAASSVRNFSNDAGKVNTDINAFMKDAKGYADGWSKSIMDGNGSLMTLLNSTKALNVERQKNRGDYTNEPHTKSPLPEDDKASKAAAKALEKHLELIGEANAKLREQEEIQRRLATFGLDYDKLGANQKKVIEIQEKLAAVGTHWAKESEAATLREELAIYKKAAALEVLNGRTIDTLKAEQAWLDKGAGVVTSIEGEVVAMRNKVATYGMLKGAVEALELAQAKQALAELEATSDGQRSAAMDTRIAQLRAEITARGELADVTAQYGQLENEAAFDKLFDAKKAEKFGNVLAEGFGKGTKALGALVNSFDKYDKRMSKVKTAWELVNKEQKDSPKYTAMARAAMELEAESRLASYADMAGAAKGFFEEGSKGYKVLEAAEKTFRLFQIAMAAKSFLEQSGLLALFTGLFVGAKATETAAEVASVGPHVAAEGVKQGANAVTALTSALAAPWPMNLVAFATVAAILASIGVAIGGGGGGGGISSKSRQEKQGTGTVFGDDAAKSASIANSIELLADNSDIALEYSSQMLYSLQSIEASLTGATSAIIRNGGSITGKGIEDNSRNASWFQSIVFGGVIGVFDKLLGGTVSKLLGFGAKTTLKDTGITGSAQSVGDIMANGYNAQSYQDYNTKKKAFGFTYSNKDSRKTQDLDPSVENEFTNVIEGMVTTLTAAASALGYSGEEVQKKLEAVTLSLGDISLKDLSAEEIQAELEAVFSGFGDQLATIVFSDSIDAFQQAGEGLLETAVRVASGVETANYELDKLGLTAIAFGDIVNVNGDVGAEIVRQSILMGEAGTGIGDIISTLSGTASDIASTYTDLLEAQQSIQLLGIADEVTRDMIRAAGGLDALRDALESYSENYFSDVEQTAMKASAVSGEFAKLGLAMPTSKAGFRSLVESLSASGVEGQLLATKVLLLADSFSELQDMTQETIDNARTDLTDAYERESEALVDVRDKFLEFSKSLGEFKTSLITGDLSTLSGLEKYNANKARYEDISTRAQAGDEDAISAFQQAAQDFLTSSRDVYASSATYTSDFERVLAETSALEASTAGKASVAEQQLAALDAQVSGLITVNESVLSVVDAINALQAAMSLNGTTGLLPEPDRTTALSADTTLTATEGAPTPTVPTSEADAALLAEISALRAEVAALRAEQAQQTGALINANFMAADSNAQAVTEGQREAASIASYNSTAKVNLA